MNKMEFSDVREVLITPENVKKLGENIALYTLKRLYGYREEKLLHKLYYGLLCDLHSMGNPSYTISDGYDYAQEAMIFLYGHMGENLGTEIQMEYRDGVKSVSLFHACTSILGRYYREKAQYHANTVSIEKTEIVTTVEPFMEDDRKKQLDRVDKIIAGMNLTKKQMLTLDCYMQSMGTMEVVRTLHKCISTIWFSRVKIQKKYMAYMGY